jgi:hypothetical protein
VPRVAAPGAGQIEEIHVVTQDRISRSGGRSQRALRSLGVRWARGALRGLLVATFLMSGALPALAAQGPTGRSFDHTATGFPLDGQHQTVRCEDCHVRGIFKGTSPMCASCHVQGSMVTAVFFPATHFPTGPLPAGAAASATVASSAQSVLLGQPCDSCHTTTSFFGAHFVHDNVAPGTCNACHNGIFAEGKPANHIPVGNLSCDQCHATVSFATSYLATPANHIPIVAAANCTSCHDRIAAGSFTSVVLPMPHDGLVVGTCASCHDGAAPFAGSIFTPNPGSGGGGTFGTQLGVNFAPKQISAVGAQNGHIPLPAGDDCNNCHVNKTYSAFGPNTAMVHSNITGACASCHSVGMAWQGVGNLVTPGATHLPPANGSGIAAVDCASCHSNMSFATGGFHITTMPVMSVPAHTAVAAAVPLCATCHEASSADLGFQGVGGNIYLRPDTALSGLSKGLGQDPQHGTGNEATQDCGVCHKSTAPPFTANLGTPSNHIPLNSSSVSCADCHANGYAPGLTTMKHSDVTTATPQCATCHNTSTVFAGTGQGTLGQPWQMSGAVASAGGSSTVHFPPGAGGCNGSGCHAVSDALTSNGAGFFLTGTNPVLSAAGHATVNESCETCHAIGSSWKGVATLVTPLATHIPPDNVAGSAVACASCHASNGYVTGGFKLSGTPGGAAAVMSPAMHSAVAAAVPQCETCHEANAANLTYQGIAGSIYLRPDTATSGLSLGLGQDAAHGSGLAATADCASSGCHASTTGPFTGFPSGHIAVVASVACATCHTTNTTSVVLPMPHAGTVSGSCASCHNTSTVFTGSVFTPASGSAGGGTFGTQVGSNFQPKQIIAAPAIGTPGGHLPLPSGDDCNVCHTSTAYQSFGPSTAMVHTNISSGCNACHNLGQTWYGVSSLVTPTAQHIPPANTTTPASVDCSSCHYTAGETFAAGGFHLSGTPGTAGAVMTPAMHTAVATAEPMCETCHEANAANLTYQGILGNIYLRPNNGSNSGLSQATDTAHVGNAATLDCGSTCHGTTGPFQGFPSGHIAVVSGATCANCHTTNQTSVVLPMPHAQVSGTCASCHNTATKFAGSIFTPNASGGGGTFGTQTGVNFQPKQIIASPAIGSSGGHIPLPSGDDCNICHTSTTYAAFGPGTAMVHTNITSGCATCHANGALWYGVAATATMLQTTGGKVLSPLHVPVTGATNAACEECHSTTVFTSFGPSTQVNHTSGRFMTWSPYTTRGALDGQGGGSAAPACTTCHAPGGKAWYGVSLDTETMGNHQGSVAANDCENCHNNTSQFGAAGAAAAALRHRLSMAHSVGPGLRAPAPGTGGTGSTGNTGGATPVAAAAPGGVGFTHVGVLPGRCAGCHASGATATPSPASHLPTRLGCDSCHRTSSWLPALFLHDGIGAGSCATCHGGNGATAKPAGHMATLRSCDSCHQGTTSWAPVSYAHFDLVYAPHPATVACVACHVTRTEQVVWKFANLKPGCGGCHGPKFDGARAARDRLRQETRVR